jgi:hypothetical protein
MEIVIDIETLPSHINEEDRIINEIIESGNVKCKLKKNELIEALGGGSSLKYKTVDELSSVWISENPRQAAMEAYKSRSLDGTYGILCSVVMQHDGQVFHAALSSHEDCENRILHEFDHAVNDILKQKGGNISKPFFVGHNVTFDLSFLYKRLVINGIKRSYHLPFNGWHDKDYFDTMVAWAGKGNRISQDALCKALGIEGKPDDIDGSKVYDYAKADRYSEILEYNIDDVKKCGLIYNRLK